MCSGCATFEHPATPEQPCPARKGVFGGRSAGPRRGSHDVTTDVLVDGSRECFRPSPRARVGGLCFQLCFESKDRQPRTRGHALSVAALSTGHKVMRPNTEMNFNDLHGQIASRCDAGSAKASRASTARPSIPSQPGLWSPRSASPGRRQSAAARQSTSKRLFNAQQDAHRRDSSGGDSGCRSAWSKSGGIRL